MLYKKDNLTAVRKALKFVEPEESSGKRLLHEHERPVRKLAADLRQFGVAIPGGLEALVHAREEIEHLLLESPNGCVVLDLDLVNCVSTLEWPAIRDALAEFVPASKVALNGSWQGPSTRRR